VNDIDKRVEALYDEYVREHSPDGGVKFAEAREGIRDEVVDLIRATERDVYAEAEALLNTSLGGLREKRSRGLKRQLEHLLDGFDEDGPYIDPILDMAFRLGDSAGVDKTLRFWTADDLRDLVVVRYRIAADGTEAAKELDKTANRVVDRMLIAGAHFMGDADWSVRP